jgi:flagellar hook assembly protein FlgD
LPRSFALEQNVPNPFSGTTTIRFALPTASSVKIELFDLFGRRIRTLTDAQWAAGYHQVEWDRRDASGNTVHSGVFMYRMTAGTFADNKRTVVLQ